MADQNCLASCLTALLPPTFTSGMHVQARLPSKTRPAFNDSGRDRLICSSDSGRQRRTREKRVNMMKSSKITIERLDLVSKKSFEQVLFELDKGIGRPIVNYFERKAVTQSFEEYEHLVNEAIGTSDLVEFLRFDPGEVFRRPGS